MKTIGHGYGSSKINFQIYFRKPFVNSRIQGIQKKLKIPKFDILVNFEQKKKVEINYSKGNTQYIHSFLSQIVKNSISKIGLTLYCLIRLESLLMQYKCSYF